MKIHYSMCVNANIERSLIKACVNDALKVFNSTSIEAIDSVEIEAIYKSKKTRPNEKLANVLKSPQLLVLENDNKVLPKQFLLRYSVDLNKSVFKSRKKIIERLEANLILFFDNYAVNLKNWKPSLKDKK